MPYSQAARAGFAGQHHESSLVGVLGRVGVAKHAPADVQDHRPVPSDQGRKGILVAVGGEGCQQVVVADGLKGSRREQTVEVLQQAALTCRHCSGSARDGNALLM